MRQSFSLCCLVVVVGFLSAVRGASLRQDQDWLSWKQKFDKVYESVNDEATHKQVWLNNLRLVERHNNRLDVDFKMEMNQFADQVMKRSSIGPAPVLFGNDEIRTNSIVSFAPASWDWRTKGAVSPVVNQGMIGDVLVVVAKEELDSYNFIHKGKLSDVSLAEIAQCCNKHLEDTIFPCIHNIGGVCSTADYPSSQGSCKNDSCTPVVKISGGAKVLPVGDEEALMMRVYQMPVMAAIDASQASFQMYSTGIYSDTRCSPERLDHVVQVVGYGSDSKGNDFWICKNSWGVNWGMKGYFMLARNKENMCGIATSAYYPV